MAHEFHGRCSKIVQLEIHRIFLLWSRVLDVSDISLLSFAWMTYLARLNPEYLVRLCLRCKTEPVLQFKTSFPSIFLACAF